MQLNHGSYCPGDVGPKAEAVSEQNCTYLRTDLLVVGHSVTIQPKPPPGKPLTTHCQRSTPREHLVFTLKDGGRFVTVLLNAATDCMALVHIRTVVLTLFRLQLISEAYHCN